MISARLDVELARIAAPAALYTLVYLLTWRPLTALGLLILGGTVLFAANAIKRRVVFEPIVFSDFALLGQIVRHPGLYFLDRTAHLTVPAALAAVVILSVAIVLERPLWPPLPLVGVVVFVGVLIWWKRRSLERRYADLLLDPATGWGSRVLGLPAALMLQVLSAITRGPAPAISPIVRLPCPPRDLVVIQIESFVDLSQWPGSYPDLPTWSWLKSAASRHGSLLVDARGANTMRTEFAVLTGIPGAALELDRFDPYLRRSEPSRGLPNQLREAGWTTSFVHPNDIAFFRRHRAMPELGFSDVRDIASFVGAERIGRYVSDLAVVDAILEILDASQAPSFIFAATMQNHGPWSAGSYPGKPVGLPSYLAHQADMDRALEKLVSALKGRARPPVLVLYGDHCPALDERKDIALEGFPSYAIVDLEEPAQVSTEPAPLRPEELLPAAFALARSKHL